MNKIVIEWLASLVRKMVFGAGLTWLVAILKDSGATDADIDRWIKIGITVILRWRGSGERQGVARDAQRGNEIRRDN